MKVGIKQFNVEMNLKNKGMEIEVRDNDETFLGDLVVTRAGLIWCRGKQQRKQGVHVNWKDFIQIMENQR
jgi:hypothetical protein